MKKGDFKQLEKMINYCFSDKDLLMHALTHKTFAYESSEAIEFNERLEFLGDSVLNFIVAEQLYRTNKYFSEGELTRRRANLVNNKFLGKRARDLGLGYYLRLGKGEDKQNGASNRTNLANALEALIGAVYLDSNLQQAKDFVLENIFTEKM